MAQNGGCGYPVINFGPTVTGDPLKCGTMLFWCNPKRDELILCRACTEKLAAEEAATAPKEK